MFTGLVECIGDVLSVSRRAGSVHTLRIRAPKIASEVKLGESIAVSGACLTVVSGARDSFEVEMMKETVLSTRLGALKTGERVNLERALLACSRLDGHMVAGHVDEVGVVSRVESAGDTMKCWVSTSPSIACFIAGKGSVTLDGVSLTVIDAGEEMFSVGLIPTTLRETTVGGLKEGDRVNIEVDMIARYLARLMQCGVADEAQVSGGITWEKIQKYGWA